MRKDLSRVAYLCNVGRNAAVRAWERYCEDHKWMPDAIVGKDGVPHTLKDGSPRVKKMPLPMKIGERSGGMILYDSARAASPQVNSGVMTACYKQVWDRLKSETPSDHGGFAEYRFHAVLRNEVSRDCYRSVNIPAPAATTGLVWGDAHHQPTTASIKAGKSSCVVDFPLWSKDAGREQTRCICRLKIGKLTPGNKRLLREIITTPGMMQGSSITRKDGVWYFNLAYKVPTANLHLDQGRVAVLEALKGADFPFKITAPGGESWTLGHARQVAAQWARLEDRRRAMRAHRRNSNSTGANSRGFKRAMRDLKKPTRYANMLADDFRKQLVAEILRFCVRFNCGAIQYHEPPVMARGKYWFDANGVQFNWGQFASHLAFKCQVHCLLLSDGKKVKASKPKRTKGKS